MYWVASHLASHVGPPFGGNSVELRTKLGARYAKPVIPTFIDQNIVPFLVTDSRLRNLAQKLGLELLKARWVVAQFRAVSINCVANDVATSFCLHDSGG